jgi:hypothetical protein
MEAEIPVAIAPFLERVSPAPVVATCRTKYIYGRSTSLPVYSLRQGIRLEQLNTVDLMNFWNFCFIQEDAEEDPLGIVIFLPSSLVVSVTCCDADELTYAIKGSGSETYSKRGPEFQVAADDLWSEDGYYVQALDSLCLISKPELH